MKKSKYYSESGDEICHELEHFLDNYLDGTIIYEMKRDIGSRDMYCEYDPDFYTDQCGKDCDAYFPCNGISGRCASLKNKFIETGRQFIIKDGDIDEYNM
jgi:hypothetical protein